MQHNWRSRDDNLGAIQKNLGSRGFSHFNTSRSGEGQRRDRNHSQPKHNSRDNSNKTQYYRDDNRTRYNRDNNKENVKQKRSMSFKYIESLLEQSSEDIAMKLMNDLNGLEELTKAQISNDFLVLLIKMLKKICESSFTHTKYQILQIAFNEKFSTTLSTFIATLPNQDEDQRKDNNCFWKDTDEFCNNLLYICDDLLKTIPTVGCKIALKILESLNLYLPLLENVCNLHVADAIKNKIKCLLEAVAILKKEDEEKAAAVDDYDDIEPPNDFRSINIYPSVRELKGECEFLRPNIVKGAYKDINHYLDIQFRLLREDFVAPLRKGIQTYLSNQTTDDKVRLENIRVYCPIRFLQHETVRQNYTLRIRFNFTKQKNKSVNYEDSKHFMFGSLLCFTNDNFKTIIFGKVEQRELADLYKGELLVGFDQPTNVSFDKDYIMVESNVYFEPYYHVLNVLQRLTIEHFPMEKYLIYCQSDVTPRYFSAESLIERNTFNESQLDAFAAALTQKFVLIQGPPGTGKTYVGLKIAEAILSSRSYWCKHTPMLVICFTNHALDQFLEGLLTYTEDIIRVGGQSKNEKLNQYNLRERRRFKQWTERYEPNKAIIHIRTHINRILDEIESWRKHLHKLNRYDSIISFSVFHGIAEHFANSWISNANNAQILAWLLGGRGDQSEEEEEEEEEKENPDIVRRMADVRINDGEKLLEAVEVEIDDMSSSRYLISLTEFKTRIRTLEKRLIELQQTEDLPLLEKFIDLEIIENQLRQSIKDYNYLQKRLDQGRLQQFNHPLPVIHSDDLQNIRPYLRWALYFNWLEQYKQEIIERLSILDRIFRRGYKIYEELRKIEDIQFMQEADVIGMTTTSAARLHSSLQALKCSTVIVEEAAEVLEAHIVTALTPYCKRLILVGDHQQLKPSAADYRIESYYKLGISLFERMVLNKIQCFTLNTQHRMRPEISSLVSTTIYPFLKDHESVKCRPPIHGTDHVLYFLDHQIYEQECTDNSKKNVHEAEFLLAYANHLILNGYESDNITIIAAYLGQMFEMNRIRKSYHLLQNLRIVVLDNYQGEQCDIILLSLVRSNKENKIGFLKIHNRVCVALSRARNGLFIMGNMEQLSNKSDLWSQINEILKKQNAIGPELPLRCEIHPEVVSYVKTANDFARIPEGGCHQKCDFKLACQHYCTKLCHVIDRSHEEYKCPEICAKQLCDKDATHKCTDMCYEECKPCNYEVLKQLPCKHEVYLKCSDDIEKHQCVVLVATILPCGHEAEKPCHCDPTTFPCPHPCETSVEPCGHTCLLTCHIKNDPDHLEYRCGQQCARFMKNCTAKVETHICRKLCHEECDECNIEVLKKRTKCPHAYTIVCPIDVDNDIDCRKPCTNTLECGHKCKNLCNETCGNCREMIDKTIAICGHIVKTECSKEPDRKYCKQNCPLLLPCGHPCTKKCHQPCTQQCEVIVDDSVVGKCGHTIKQTYCYMKTTNNYNNDKLLTFCKEPCMVELKCGHKCAGNCGECSQSRLHKRCQEKCGVQLICNHECQFPCGDACRPCNLPNSFHCVHSKCNKLCGQFYTACKERCSRSCKHQKCNKLCGYICDIKPCNQPCDLQLECGHECVGLCGEPCPPCRICDTDGNYEIFFADEDHANAKFVILNDCKHVIENERMEQWLVQDNRVGFKTCPKCESSIKTTERYSDEVKRAHQDIVKIRKRSVGTSKSNDKEREGLLKKVKKMKDNRFVYYRYYTSLGKLIDDFHQRLKTNNRGKRQMFDKFILNGITRKYQIIEQIFEICNFKDPSAVPLIYQQLDFITTALRRYDTDFISDQEIDDIQHEIARLVRIVEYNKLQQSPNFANVKQDDPSLDNFVQQLENCLLNPIKYTEMIDKEIHQLLKQINTAVSGGLAISDVEHRQILSAMSLTKGHWFKCSNGHVYAIDECVGGAMQESKCNACGAVTGEHNH